jgi:DNA-binding IclR family transcriptional regulator
MDKSMPALERAIAVLEELGKHAGGLPAPALAKLTGIPRATLYRMLRVLTAHAYVVQGPAGYVLGAGIGRLAARVPVREIAVLAQPIMDALCAQIGESVKLVARDGMDALTLAAAHSGNDARIAVRIGYRIPLYVGASQRLLLSRAPADIVAAVLSMPRRRVASGTITGARVLRADIERLRGERVAVGHSEGVEGVGAIAARVDDATGATRAVLVSVFIQMGKSAARLRQIRDATVAAAGELSHLLGGG